MLPRTEDCPRQTRPHSPEHVLQFCPLFVRQERIKAAVAPQSNAARRAMGQHHGRPSEDHNLQPDHRTDHLNQSHARTQNTSICQLCRPNYTSTSLVLCRIHVFCFCLHQTCRLQYRKQSAMERVLSVVTENSHVIYTSFGACFSGPTGFCCLSTS